MECHFGVAVAWSIVKAFIILSFDASTGIAAAVPTVTCCNKYRLQQRSCHQVLCMPEKVVLVLWR
jgi:hypothetical protein